MFKDAKAFSGFSVDDTSKAATFYRDVLGLDVTEDKYMPDLLEITLGTGANVMVYPKGDGHEPASFTVLNFPVSDIDAAVDALVKKGVQVEHYDNEYMKTDEKGIARSGKDNPGPSIAWFKDPAGNIMAVLESE